MSMNSNVGSPKTPPVAPQKPNKGVIRRRPVNWENDNTYVAPVQQKSRVVTQKPVGGIMNIATQMVRDKVQRPVVVPISTPKYEENENMNDDEEVVTLTNMNLQNTTSYFDEINSLLKSYYPGQGKVHMGRNGVRFMLNSGVTQNQKDEKARRDYRSLLGYIDRIEQDYVIPSELSDFVKTVRAYEPYPEKVNEQLMMKISENVFPVFNEYTQYISRKTIMNLGPKKGGRRTRRHRRNRRRITYRRR